MSDKNYCWLLLSFVVAYTIGFFSGIDTGIKTTQKEAIREECAHYSVDKNGNPVFTWNIRKN